MHILILLILYDSLGILPVAMIKQSVYTSSLGLLFFLFLSSNILTKSVVTAQNQDSSITLSEKIDMLSKANDIIGVNKLINMNHSLEPEYALKTLRQNLETALSKDDHEAIAYTYLSLGNFWLIRGNNVKAYENFYQSEKNSIAFNFPLITGLAIMNRSILESDNEVKIVLLRQAIGYFSQGNDPVNLAKAHLNLGQAFSSYILRDSLQTLQGEIRNGPETEIGVRKEAIRDSAFRHYVIAETLNDSLSHPEITASVYVHYAEWHHFENDFDSAIRYYQLASDFFGKSGQLKGQIYCQKQTAMISLVRLEYDNALEQLEKGASLAEKFGFNDYVAEIYQLIVRVYDSLENYQKAFESQKKYMDAYVQLSRTISQDKIHALNLEYALLEQNTIIEVFHNKKRSNRLIIIFSIALAVFAIVISYLMFVNKKRKIDFITKEVEKSKKLNELQKKLIESNQKKQELRAELYQEKTRFQSERIMMIANQMNKLESFLQSFGNEMKSVVEKPREEGLIEKVNALKISLAQSIHDQTNIKEFVALSNETNQDFLFYVEQKYTGITKDDLKLLSYLILNMDSKEIASHFSISAESVHKKRYRLRQKLQIEAGKSFADFYKETLARIVGSGLV